MQPTQTELQRQLDNLIDTVTAVRSGECRVKTGALMTNWQLYAAARAGENSTRHYPARVRNKPSKTAVATLSPFDQK